VGGRVVEKEQKGRNPNFQIALGSTGTVHSAYFLVYKIYNGYGKKK
jgi:hypothetical protein